MCTECAEVRITNHQYCICRWCLCALQKLYLQGNCLAALDHLTAATRLEELHVSDQHLQHCQHQPRQQKQQKHGTSSSCSQSIDEATSTAAAVAVAAGTTEADQQAVMQTGSPDGLQLDAASLQAMSGSLKVLAAANCGIRDPGPLAVLKRLQTLDLSGNNISKLEALQPVLRALQQLRVLDIRHNPCVLHELKYRDYIILLAADTLKTLDGDPVQAAHRAFLLGLHLNKLPAQDKGELEEQQQQHHQQQPGQQLVGKRLAGKLLPAAAAAGEYRAAEGAAAAGAAAAGAPSVSLTATGVKLHALRAPAARPTAAGGFNASSARIAAALAGPTQPSGSGQPVQGLNQTVPCIRIETANH